MSIPGARLARSVEEVRAAIIASGAALWVVKDPFGVAGRGRLLGVTASVLDDAGHYVGSRLGVAPDPLEGEIVAAALLAGARLAAEGYEGPPRPGSTPRGASGIAVFVACADGERALAAERSLLGR